MTKFSLEHTEGQPVLSCPVANLYETAHQMSGSRTDGRLMGPHDKEKLVKWLVIYSSSVAERGFVE